MGVGSDGQTRYFFPFGKRGGREEIIARSIEMENIAERFYTFDEGGQNKPTHGAYFPFNDLDFMPRVVVEERRGLCWA
jgi:hypothetical protein